MPEATGATYLAAGCPSGGTGNERWRIAVAAPALGVAYASARNPNRRPHLVAGPQRDVCATVSARKMGASKNARGCLPSRNIL